jgi:hypothetical protein
MSNTADFPDRPALLQQPPHAFKPIKAGTLLLAILVSAVLAGTGGYLLGNEVVEEFGCPVCSAV